MRIDRKTGKKYLDNNIPEGKLNRIKTADGKEYCIMAQNGKHPETVWYDGNFVGDYYGVFVKVYIGTENYFWQMVSNWYFRYGNAVNKMCKLAKEN